MRLSACTEHPLVAGTATAAAAAVPRSTHPAPACSRLDDHGPLTAGWVLLVQDKVPGGNVKVNLKQHRAAQGKAAYNTWTPWLQSDMSLFYCQGTKPTMQTSCSTVL